MVLYELLTQRTPFKDVQPAAKRNQKVWNGQRPSLKAKEERMPLKLHELMELCWEKEAEDRPNMQQVVEWVQAPEFLSLRAKVSLKDVKFISSCCVVPENELDSQHTSTDAQTDKAGEKQAQILPNLPYMQSSLSMSASGSGAGESSRSLGPSSQVWMCGEGGSLHIVTYHDNNPGYQVMTEKVI